MKKNKFPHKFAFVHVEWVDHAAEGGRWTRKKDFGGPLFVHTVGQLVQETNTHITVASSCDENSDPHFGEVIHIVRKGIIKIRKLK